MNSTNLVFCEKNQSPDVQVWVNLMQFDSEVKYSNQNLTDGRIVNVAQVLQNAGPVELLTIQREKEREFARILYFLNK